MREREAEIGIEGRAKGGKRLIGSDAVVVESHGHVRAPVEPLLIKEIGRAGILLDYGYARKGIRRRRIGMVNRQRSSDDRVKARHR